MKKGFNSPIPSLLMQSESKRVYAFPRLYESSASDSPSSCKTPILKQISTYRTPPSSCEQESPIRIRRVSFIQEQIPIYNNSENIFQNKSQKKKLYAVFGCFVTLIASLLVIYN